MQLPVLEYGAIWSWVPWPFTSIYNVMMYLYLLYCSTERYIIRYLKYIPIESYLDRLQPPWYMDASLLVMYQHLGHSICTSIYHGHLKDINSLKITKVKAKYVYPSEQCVLMET